MPFERPDLKTIISRISSDIESRFEGADAAIRRTFYNTLSKALAGAVHGIYGYMDYMSEQLMPDTSEKEYLERWGRIWGVTRKQAAYASGDVIFTGTNGTVIDAGTTLQRSDGVEFKTDEAATVSSGSATVSVTSVDSGSDGNTDAAASLNLVSPISGINSSATVDTGLTDGTDIEENDDMLARLLSRIQQPPHGGAIFDYVTWALEVDGVTRAWAYAEHLGIGTVGLCFVMDNQEDSIIPDFVKVLEVQNYIDHLRPVTADLTVFAPTAVELNFTIAITPDTSAVRTSIETELTDLLSREAEPGGTILLSHINEAISIAAGETDHTLTSPAANVTHSTGEIAVMGTITWS